jgi:mono/diheme cytochrome c family protein
MKKQVAFILFFIGFMLYSCSPMLYLPASNDPVEQENLLKGRMLYVKNCNSCHNLHLPKEFTADKWLKNLNEMQERSKITNEDKQLIFAYLTSKH